MATEHDSLPLPELPKGLKVLIVRAPYYRAIADDLLAGAVRALDAAGVAHELLDVPGALEIPPAIALSHRSGRYDGYVALGCVIRGETLHFEIVCTDSSRGLMELGLKGICIGNGILTMDTMEQATVRAEPDGLNKGGGAAEAALHLIALARRTAPPAPEGRAPAGSFKVADRA